MDAIARLKSGVTFERAKADVEAIGKHHLEEVPDANKGSGTIFPFRQDWVEDVRLSWRMLPGAVGFVLLIVCVKLASLLLAQPTGRIRELSVHIVLAGLLLALGGLGALVRTSSPR